MNYSHNTLIDNGTSYSYSPPRQLRKLHR